MVHSMLLSLAAVLVSGCADAPFQDLDLGPALDAAKRDHKIVMIDYFTTWCGPCKKLDSTTWKDPEVRKWLAEKTISLKIDAEEERELATQHRIQAYPTLLFLAADGSEMDRIVGYKAPEEFLSEANAMLAGKNAVARAREKLVGYEDSPMARAQYGDVLARAGRYEEALEEYLWCFDNGRKVAAYRGVRLSFLLSDIARLVRVHPPALRALEERRDAAAARLIAGSESMDDAREAVAIDRTLETPKRSVELYDQLRAAKPLTQDLEVAFGREIVEPLVEARRYQDAVDLFDNPEGFVTGHIKMNRATPKLQVKDDPAIREAMEGAARAGRERTVRECAQMYEAILGVGQKDVAAKIADHLIEFSPTGSTYSTLVLSAVRADATAEARSLGARGLEKLPEGERDEVRKALETIPQPK